MGGNRNYFAIPSLSLPQLSAFHPRPSFHPFLFSSFSLPSFIFHLLPIFLFLIFFLFFFFLLLIFVLSFSEKERASHSAATRERALRRTCRILSSTRTRTRSPTSGAKKCNSPSLPISISFLFFILSKIMYNKSFYEWVLERKENKEKQKDEKKKEWLIRSVLFSPSIFFSLPCS